MKKAFIITSMIEVDNDSPLTYSETRSYFDSEHRFRQTIATIANLDARFPEDTTFYIVDGSKNFDGYKSILQSYQKNLKFISIEQEFPDVINTIRTHSNKSYCEICILNNFFNAYKEELKEYDYIFKISGRYFIDGSFGDELLNKININKIFFKKYFEFEWNENWQYQRFDRRQIQNDNKLRQYSSVLYGFGRENLELFVDLYKGLEIITRYENVNSYELESLLYFYTRDFESKIIETNWIVYGFDGTNGNFIRY